MCIDLPSELWHHLDIFVVDRSGCRRANLWRCEQVLFSVEIVKRHVWLFIHSFILRWGGGGVLQPSFLLEGFVEWTVLERVLTGHRGCVAGGICPSDQSVDC